MSVPSPTACVDVLVIGAGPAGLALGRELLQRGVSFLIIERGEHAGESWRRMPTRLRLVSPWMSNFLPGTKPSLFPRFAEISREEFRQYLIRYAAEFELPILHSTDVHRVTRDPEGIFRTETSRGTLRSRAVVNATGYFSKPHIPKIPGSGTSRIPQWHVAEYGDAIQLRSHIGAAPGPVLLVGQRLSAGQTLVELVAAGFEVALSHRSPLRFGAGPTTMWLFLRIFPLIEELKLKLHGPAARDWDVKMPGDCPKNGIRTGRTKTHPAIAEFTEREVRFMDGSSLAPSAVIYATGFEPALDHLAPLLPEIRDTGGGAPALRDMESLRVPGLFFLGLAGLRNFQSRYIRGIRRDAGPLADRVVARLAELRPLEATGHAAPTAQELVRQ